MGELSPPLSAMIMTARLGGTAVRRADRASVACLLPRHAVESSGGATDCAELSGTGKCDCCCGSAARLSVDDCAAVHSDGGPGAGVETSAVTELRVAVAVSLPVRTLPMFRTAQTSLTPTKASEQKTDLHRSLGTPQGWTTVQRGWSPPRCCCWRDDMATRCEILRLFHSNIPSHSILLFYSREWPPRR